MTLLIILYLYSLIIFLFYFLIVASLRLVAWSLEPGAWSLLRSVCVRRPGPATIVQLAHPSPASFSAPNASISCCRSFIDLTFFIIPFYGTVCGHVATAVRSRIFILLSNCGDLVAWSLVLLIRAIYSYMGLTLGPPAFIFF